MRKNSPVAEDRRIRELITEERRLRQEISQNGNAASEGSGNAPEGEESGAGGSGSQEGADFRKSWSGAVQVGARPTTETRTSWGKDTLTPYQAPAQRRGLVRQLAVSSFEPAEERSFEEQRRIMRNKAIFMVIVTLLLAYLVVHLGAS